MSEEENSNSNTNDKMSLANKIALAAVVVTVIGLILNYLKPLPDPGPSCNEVKQAAMQAFGDAGVDAVKEGALISHVEGTIVACGSEKSLEPQINIYLESRCGKKGRGPKAVCDYLKNL